MLPKCHTPAPLTDLAERKDLARLEAFPHGVSVVSLLLPLPLHHHHHHHHHGSASTATSTAEAAAAGYAGPNVHPSPAAEYARGGKCYYEQGQLQHHAHQGGEASSIPNSYVSSPDPFPSSAPGMATTATAIAAATAAVITPGAQPDDSYAAANNSYGNFYAEPASMPHAAPPPPSADNSNSSSDFNFLTNLANDFAPEYYQLS